MKMFSRSVTVLALIAGFCCASAYYSAARAALNCTFSITNTAFGSVDVTANTVFDTTATLTLNCTGINPAQGARVCISLGAGSGGGANAANRLMKSGANTLTYSLFTDAARTSVWGSYVWAGAGAPGVQINFLGVGGATQSASRTVYGRVFSGQQTALAGTYSSTFSGTSSLTAAQINFGTPLQVGNCTTNQDNDEATFNVTATVPTTCTIAANNLNFGTVGALTSNTDATTTLQPKCTNATPYNIGLDKGVNGGSVTTRQMKAGSALINYSLFSNSGRTTNWGNTVGTDTVSGTGTGTAQSLNVYGRIPAQATPSPATYNDTIVVTLTY